MLEKRNTSQMDFVNSSLSVIPSLNKMHLRQILRGIWEIVTSKWVLSQQNSGKKMEKLECNVTHPIFAMSKRQNIRINKHSIKIKNRRL
jgi:hypothetical protein